MHYSCPMNNARGTGKKKKKGKTQNDKCGHGIQTGTISINNCILVFQYKEVYFILSVKFLLIITIGIKLIIITSSIYIIIGETERKSN